MHYNCLIVDDEKMLAESTSEYFNLFNVTTASVTNSKDCIDFLENNTIDVLLLDINLENESGFDLCKKIRTKYKMPILFISARQSDDDIVAALTIGGDDYIKKPYSLSVLIAKVKVMIKRFSNNENEEETAVYQNQRIKVDFTTGKLFISEKEVLLKAMEYRLLVYLIKNKGRIVNKEELFKEVWQDSITGDGTLNVHIRHLREKIEENPNNPEYIKTVWGRGYVFEEK